MQNTIILLGMSGVGKSYNGRILEHKYGYKLFCIDDMIARELGERDVHNVAKFLGAPFEDRYFKNSTKYLSLEEKFTKEALLYASLHKDEKVVIDTTGSVVHLPVEVLVHIKSFRNSIFLDSKDSLINSMINQYLKQPKPVIWGELTNQFKDKSRYEEILKDIYPKLLYTRRRKYRTYSRTIIPFNVHKGKNFNILKYVDSVKNK